MITQIINTNNEWFNSKWDVHICKELDKICKNRIYSSIRYMPVHIPTTGPLLSKTLPRWGLNPPNSMTAGGQTYLQIWKKKHTRQDIFINI